MELERPAPRWSMCFAKIECLMSDSTAFLEQDQSPGPHVTCSGYTIKSLGDCAEKRRLRRRPTDSCFVQTRYAAAPRARAASSWKYTSVRSSPVVRSVSG